MPVSAKMLSLLRDPVGLDALELDGDYLVNRAGQRRYPIIESIPVLIEPATLGPQNLKFQRMYDWMSHIYDLGLKVGSVFSGGKLAEIRRLLATKLALKPGTGVYIPPSGPGRTCRIWRSRFRWRASNWLAWIFPGNAQTMQGENSPL